MLSVSGVACGTWKGSGEGFLQGGRPGFAYDETLIISGDQNRPFLKIEQTTVEAKSKRPLHAEVGFIRLGSMEMTMTSPTGVCEALVGKCCVQDDGSIELTFETAEAGPSASIARVPKAKSPHVQKTRRSYHFSSDGSRLTFTFHMQTDAEGATLFKHLQASLEKQL
jgi:hypothetical protein